MACSCENTVFRCMFDTLIFYNLDFSKIICLRHVQPILSISILIDLFHPSSCRELPPTPFPSLFFTRAAVVRWRRGWKLAGVYTVIFHPITGSNNQGRSLMFSQRGSRGSAPGRFKGEEGSRGGRGEIEIPPFEATYAWQQRPKAGQGPCREGAAPNYVGS